MKTLTRLPINISHCFLAAFHLISSFKILQFRPAPHYTVVHRVKYDGMECYILIYMYMPDPVHCGANERHIKSNV